jgi:hypothetical protein
VRRRGGDAGEGQRLLWGAHLEALEVFPGEAQAAVEAAAEVLTEADGAAGERAFVAEAPSGGAEEAPPSARWPA